MLESSFSLPNGSVLPHRLAKAAMSEGLAAPDGRVTEPLIRLYRRWAEGGAGLLITGNVMVDDRARELASNVVLENDRDIASLQRWAQAAKSHRGRIWMQINHPGRQVPRTLSKQPVAPSTVAVEIAGRRGMFAQPRALTEAEIEAFVERFGRTAALAEAAGFDGVQIHAAHGYLISQFLSPRVNQRQDRWGGSLENRSRFLLEVVRTIRRRVSSTFDVGLKLNSADFQRGGFAPEDAHQVVAALDREGIDLLEISGGSYEQPSMLDGSAVSERTRQREAFFLDYARRMRDAARMPLMVTGGFRSREAMEAALKEGAIDVVGVARPFAFDPDVPRKLLGNAQMVAAIPESRPLRNSTLNGLAQTALAQRQFQRLGKGLLPLTTSVRLNLVRSIIHTEIAARRYHCHMQRRERASAVGF